MTGTELQNRIIANLGGRDDKDTEILQAVNDAIARISALRRWSINESTESITLATDTAEYSLPARTKAIIAAYLEQSSGRLVVLEAVSTFRFDRIFKAGNPVTYDVSSMDGDHTDGVPLQQTGIQTGEPISYCHFGGELIMYPIPTSSENGLTVYLRCNRRPAEIAGGSDNPLGDDFDRLVIAYATADMCAQLTLWDDEKNWERRAIILLREAIQEERARPDWTPRLNAAGIARIP